MILSPNYTFALTAKFIDSDYISFDDRWFYDQTLKYDRKKKQALELLLLFEKIYLIGADSNVDYTKPISDGLIEILSNSDDKAFRFFEKNTNDIKEYANLLKPIVLSNPFLQFGNDINTYLKSKGITSKKLLSELFNLRFEQEYHLEILKVFYQYFLEKSKNVDSQVAIPPENIVMVHANRIGNFTGQLMHYLDISSSKDAPIILDEFKLADNNPLHKKFADFYSNAYGAFQILVVQMGNLIGTFPVVNSIYDVISLKAKKRKELNNLREIILEIEEALRQSKPYALWKSKNLIDKASKDLRHGINYSKISKWTTYLSVPVGTIESLIGIPPIAGFTMGLIGSSSTFLSDKMIKKNNWINICR